METQYSSEIVKQLLTNDKWNFWKSDWSERIIVAWNPNVNRKYFFNEIKKLLGANFNYERSVNNDLIEYEATDKGLKKLKH